MINLPEWARSAYLTTGKPFMNRTFAYVTAVGRQFAMLVVLVSSLNATTALGGPYIYWSNSAGIYRARTDGGGITQLIAANHVASMAVDAAGGKLFYSANGDRTGEGAIYVANLDGSGIEVILSGLGSLSGMDVDITNRKLYFADFDNTAETGVFRSNMDGSGVELLFRTPDWDGLKYDPIEDQVFQLSLDDDFVARFNSDGSERLGLFDATTAIGMDLAERKLYFTTAFSISRSNLDGTVQERLVECDDTNPGPAFRYGIAIDPDGRQLFAAGLYGDIFRSNLDGSSFQTIISGQKGLNSIAFVVPEPVAFASEAVGLFAVLCVARRVSRHDWTG